MSHAEIASMKRALIVGASRGIGLGLVREHLARGWNVTVTVRKPSAELESLKKEAEGRLSIETADITRANDVTGLAHRLEGQVFDLVFLNAGIMAGRGLPLVDVPNEDIVDIVMTNAISPVRVADRLIGLAGNNATIAFMSSVLGSISTNDDGRAELYRASKAALNSLILSFRARHSDRRDLTILAVHPGVVRTSMGGPDAPLDITQSVTGVTDMLEKRAGTGGAAFVNYRNEIIPW
jgi:NAD(P)-dependent dehydrogenase (short-subunit alcohol dehydrogenase family)